MNISETKDKENNFSIGDLMKYIDNDGIFAIGIIIEIEYSPINDCWYRVYKDNEFLWLHEWRCKDV